MKVQSLCVMMCLALAANAVAGPVVREAAGASAAAIQVAVDQFRADLGGPNHGTTPGSQGAGRREINWDNGGDFAPVTMDPSPVTRFIPRGVRFFTTGFGFETSGSPAPLLEDRNPAYAGLFAPFSAPRIFTPLGANTMDAVFNVPGNVLVAAGVSGFGAVFTNVDEADTTRVQFFAPDGTMLFERAVPAIAGDATLSFLGVSFDAGEIVGRVHIVTGNTAMGLPDEPGLNVVALDDFVYAEPVGTAGLVITPVSGSLFRSAAFDLVIGFDAPLGPPTGGAILFDGTDVTAVLSGCLRAGTQAAGGRTLSCSIPAGLLTPGDHVLRVDATFANQERRRSAVVWKVIANTEP